MRASFFSLLYSLLEGPHRHIHRNNVLPAIFGSLSPVRLTRKINHHNSHQIINVEIDEFLQSEHTHITTTQSRNKVLPVPPEYTPVSPSSFKDNFI